MFGPNRRYGTPPPGFVEFVIDGVKQVDLKASPLKQTYDHSCAMTMPLCGPIELSACNCPGAPNAMIVHVIGCPLRHQDDHTLESCKAKFNNPMNYAGPPATWLADGGRGIAKAQAELLSKYAAHCEAKESTCSNVATLLEYRDHAKLARDMSLIFFRAATLED